MADRLAASASGGEFFQRSKGSTEPELDGMKVAVARRSISCIRYLLFRRGSPLWTPGCVGKDGVDEKPLFSFDNRPDVTGGGELP